MEHQWRRPAARSPPRCICMQPSEDLSFPITIPKLAHWAGNLNSKAPASLYPFANHRRGLVPHELGNSPLRLRLLAAPSANSPAPHNSASTILAPRAGREVNFVFVSTLSVLGMMFLKVPWCCTIESAEAQNLCIVEINPPQTRISRKAGPKAHVTGSIPMIAVKQQNVQLISGQSPQLTCLVLAWRF